MTDEKKQRDESGESLWSMRAVSQRTGLSEHTLRAWEKRFGFPDPVRLDSGHRRYPPEQVRRLTAIQSALVRGHRIGDVIRLDEAGIDALLASDSGLPDETHRETTGTYLEACLRLDSEELATMMRQDAAILGVTRFLSEKVVPFVTAIGEGWEEGVVSIRHEHVASETVEGILRELRTPLERGLSGRPVLLATLPGELHSLGLQIVSLMIVARGVPVRVVGVETPIVEIAESASALRAPVVALSMTEAGVSQSTGRLIEELHEMLPPGTTLWLGGRGASRLRGLPAGVSVAAALEDIDELVAVARRQA